MRPSDAVDADGPANLVKAVQTAVPMKAFADAGYDGIVLAGVGGGNFNAAVQKEAENAVGKGIMVVRSTRCLLP